MTKKQFVRLFIVVFFPLLLLGFITANFVFKNSGGAYAYILCAPFLDSENCRPVGDPEGALYKSVKSKYPAWFDVTEDGYDSDSPLSNFVMASTRTVREAVIVEAVPFTGYGADVTSFMSALAGKRAMVNLGIREGQRSKIYVDGVLLACTNLVFAEKDGEYLSQCYGDGWGGPVKYRATGQSRDELDRLQQAVNGEVASRRSDYVVYRAVMYPIFIYLFLAVSLLIWATIKAARFVKGGAARGGDV